MFTWLNKQGVESDRGFVVQFVDRYTAEYREGTRKVTVEVEMGLPGGKPCIIISPNAFRRWDGDPPEAALPPKKQQEILANFSEAIEFQGLALVVE